MQNELKNWACLFVFVVLAAGLPLRAQSAAQEQSPVYSYVGEWAVPRAQWAERDKIEDQIKVLMDKLLADGTLVSYGSYSNLLHQEGEATHGSWFSATSEGKLLKGLEALYAQGNVTSPVNAASKHWDYLLVSRLYNQRSGRSDGGYLIVSFWNVKPGHMRDFSALVKSNIQPAYEKLLADGVVTSYGLESEDFHSQDPGRVDFYVTTPDAESIDKVNDAINEVFEKNPALDGAFQSVAERKGHRDYLLRLRHMANK